MADVKYPIEKTPNKPDMEETMGASGDLGESPTDLIEQLEAAETGNRKLDAKIYRIINPYTCFSTEWEEMEATPHYTTSIDAAITLVPEDMDYELVILGTADGETFTCASLKWWKKPREISEENWLHRGGNKLVPALAICIAVLKARKDISHD